MFQWEIKEIDGIAFGEKITSPSFEVSGCKIHINFYVESYNNDEDESDGSSSQIFVMLETETIAKISVHCKLLSGKEILAQFEDTNIFVGNDPSENGWGTREFANSELIKIYGKRGPLTITVDAIVLEKMTYVSGVSNETKPSVGYSLNLESALHDEATTDISVGTERAHKVILKAASPVFRAMLEIKMEESKESKIMMEEMSESSVKGLLSYIYTGNPGNADLKELIIAGDKYQIPSLVNYCSERLIKSIGKETFCELFALSSTHNIKSIKEECLKYAKREIKLIKNMKDFDKLDKSLLIELIGI